MANKLKIVSKFEVDKWIVEATVSPLSDATFPRDIFLWTLDIDGALKAFQSIGHVDQVAKYSAFDSNRTSNFGVHLVKYTSSRATLSTEQDRDNHIVVLKSAFDFLLNSYTTTATEIEEMYP